LLIIFDLDDTLIDTTEKFTPIIFRKTLQILIKKGLQISNVNKSYKKLLEIDKNSFSSKESIKRFLYELKANKIFYNIAFKVMSEPLNEDIKVFPLKNAKKILEYLSNTNTLALVSIGKEKFQFDKMKKAGIDTSFFSKIVITTNEDKGIYYKQIIDELNISFQNTYVCGDKINVDLVPAKELGCITIHMKWGRGKRFLKDNNVDYTINNLMEIKTILN
jgi:putative hydrolase of the HAD superfamily